MLKSEIVSPGGSYTKAMVAALYGAEAVYVGVPFTSLRMRQNKLNTFDDLKKTIDDLHKLGTKAYLTMNIFPRNTDLKVFESVIEQISDLGADAIIFSDPGTYNIIKRHLPKMNLHLSTQASTLNYEAIKFWYDLGVKRVVLARELHISEIAEIKKQIPEMELEAFAHGAMCMSYSGRCLLGEFFSARDGNRGECSHVCRYKYKTYIEEENRPGKLYEVGENKDGSYLLSSKDLCTLNRLAEIMPYLDGLKIEGRSKSELYVGATTKAYRHMRDCVLEGKEPDQNILNLVNEIPHRQYRDGYMLNGKGVIEEIGTMTMDHAGPLKSREYYGITLPEYIEKDGEKYIKFVPKQTIQKNQTLNYLSKDNMGKITIKNFISDKKNEDKIDCNCKEVYILTDKILGGYDITYL